MGNVRIQLCNVSKSYYSESAVTQALRHINLTFSQGEFAVITGESGSGKSTLLNIIAGLNSFDDGEFFIDGEPTFQYDETDWETYRREKIGYVFQDYSLIGHYSALENIAAALQIMGTERSLALEKAKEYLAQVGLDGLEDQKASELSSGQKQRLSIARAHAKDTGILVADEPTVNLDSETAQSIVLLLSQLAQSRLVIMVTHNYELVEGFATRKIRLHDGEVATDTLLTPVLHTSDVSMDASDDLLAAKTSSGNSKAFENLPLCDNPADSKDLVSSENEVTSEDTAPSEAPVASEDTAPSKSALSFIKKLRHRFFPAPSKQRFLTAAHLGLLNRRTQPGRTLLFTVFFFITAVASFLFLSELFYYKDDIFTKKYSQSAYYQEDATRLSIRHADGSELTEEELDQVRSLTNVVTVDSCDLANDINYYIESGRDYKITYGVQRNPGSRVEIFSYTFLNEDHFMRSTDCITQADLAAGSLPTSLTEIVVYSNDTSLIGTTKTVFFTSPNIWGSGKYCSYQMTIVGILKEETEQVYFSTEFCNMLTNYVDADYVYEYVWDEKMQDYVADERYILIIGEDLEEVQTRKGGNTLSDAEEIFLFNSILLHFETQDERGNASGQATELWAQVQSSLSNNTATFLEVSSEFFYEHYTPTTTQASIYITSYAVTDAVMNRLSAMGYEVISTYRVSADGYDNSLVQSRLIVMGICAASLLLLACAEILILRSLMKIKLKDFHVLRFMGADLSTLIWGSLVEMLLNCFLAMIAALLLLWLLRLCGLTQLDEIMWYMQAGGYFFFLLYNLVCCLLTVAAFHHLVGRSTAK